MSCYDSVMYADVTGIEVDRAREHLRMLHARTDAVASNAPSLVLDILDARVRATREELLLATYRPRFAGPARLNLVERAAETLAAVAFEEV